MKAWLTGMTLGESLGEIAGLLLVFLFVLFITYQATRWIARYSAGQVRSGSIQVIETYKLAPNRYLQIVRVAGRYLVLAVSKDQISFLTELSEEEVTAEKEEASKKNVLSTGQAASKGISFSVILERLAKGKQESDKK